MKFTLVNNYMLVSINGKNYVVDTGCPYSFSYDNTDIELDGVTYDMHSQRKAFSKADVENLIGTDIGGFIGTDIMSRTNVTFDYGHQIIDFHAQDGQQAYSIQYNSLIGIITPDILIDGQNIGDTIIDTGAAVPYVAKKYLVNAKKTDRRYEDESPFFGRMEGFLYEVEIAGKCPGNNLKPKKIYVGELPAAIALFAGACLNTENLLLETESGKTGAISLDLQGGEIRVR